MMKERGGKECGTTPAALRERRPGWLVATRKERRASDLTELAVVGKSCSSRNTNE